MTFIQHVIDNIIDDDLFKIKLHGPRNCASKECMVGAFMFRSVTHPVLRLSIHKL